MLMLLLFACLDLPLNDPLVHQALDYQIDKPRVLAMRFEPPVFAAGEPLQMDALIVAPGGLRGREARWTTCGLREDVPVEINSLQCFADGVEITEMASGEMPLSYRSPDFAEMDCSDWQLDTGSFADTGFDYWDALPCHHRLPILVESELGGETARGVTWVTWFGQSWPEILPRPTTLDNTRRRIEVIGDPVPGAEVTVRFTALGDFRFNSFRWYVDAGQLLDTGHTAAQGYAPPGPVAFEGRTWTENRWVIPEDASGPLRVFVVLSPAYNDPTAYLGSVMDLAWSELTIEVGP